MTERELGHVARGAYLRRMEREMGLLFAVKNTLRHGDPLLGEIAELEREADWIRWLPEDSPEGRAWEAKRAAVVRPAALRVC